MVERRRPDRRTRSTPSDPRGQPVLTADGAVVGEVDAVEDGELFVSPVPGLLAGYGATLAEARHAAGPFRLPADAVATIGEAGIVLKAGDAATGTPEDARDTDRRVTDSP